MYRNKKIRRVVAKFGGKSLADGELIHRAARAVAREVEGGVQIAVVASAFGDTTDTLINITKQATRGKIETREFDDILSMGERTSVRILSAALNARGVKSRYFDPAEEDWPIITNNHFTDAEPLLPECNRRIKKHVLPLLEQGIVPVIAGFIGKTLDGHVTTIGRGGSDTTAFILAKALDANEVILVTDVEGIMSADPRLVNNPRKLRVIEAKQLAELADLGARFIHKKALQYKDESINARVVSYSRDCLDAEGTVIVGSFPRVAVTLANRSKAMRVTMVGKAISEDTSITREIARELINHQIFVFGISANDDSLTWYLSQTESNSPLESLHSILLSRKQDSAMAVRKDLAPIKVEGLRLEEAHSVASKLLESLRANGINLAGFFPITSGLLVFVDWGVKDTVLNLFKKTLEGKS